MKILPLFLLVFFCTIACKPKKEENPTASDPKSSPSISFSMSDSDTVLQIYYPLSKKTVSIPKEILPIKKCIVMNTSSLAYLAALGITDKVEGVGSPEYIYNEEIHSKLDSNTIFVAGGDENWDFEKIIQSQVKFVFCIYNPQLENTYRELKDNGVHLIFIEEYLENQPLGRTHYLQLFGQLFNEKDKAEQLISEISLRYSALKIKAINTHNKPLILSKIMYGDIWYMPGGNSYSAHLYEDAGALYPWAETADSGSLNLNYEEVYTKTLNAPIWLDASDIDSKQELLMQNNLYSNFQAFQNNQVYSLGGRVKGKANDFYEQGVVRADLVLKELNYIVENYENLHSDSLYFYKKIE